MDFPTILAGLVAFLVMETPENVPGRRAGVNVTPDVTVSIVQFDPLTVLVVDI